MIFIGLLLATGAIAQELPLVDREGLMELTGRNSDTTYVVNFWATWCSPCVSEIGLFNDLHLSGQDEKLEVVLVSLDFPGQGQERVLGFLEERGIEARVVMMSDLDYNGWIDLVDPSWSGAIPATLIYRRDSRVFLEKELSREELNNYVSQIMQ